MRLVSLNQTSFDAAASFTAIKPSHGFPFFAQRVTCLTVNHAIINPYKCYYHKVPPY